MLEFPNFACYQVFSKRVAFFQNTLCSSAVPTSLDVCHFVIFTPANVFTSFLPKRPPKRERERFLGFSGPNKSGERKAEGSGLRDARTADDPPLQQVSMQPWKTILIFLQESLLGWVGLGGTMAQWCITPCSEVYSLAPTFSRSSNSETSTRVWRVEPTHASQWLYHDRRTKTWKLCDQIRYKLSTRHCWLWGISAKHN